MIRLCKDDEFHTVYSIINDAAGAYKGVIPTDCWKEPYMSKYELRHEMGEGVVPILIGTWADAVWPIRFYEKHGFRLVAPDEKDQLLKKYWTVPGRQIETSVVLR